MTETSQVLSKVELFEGLSDEQLAAIAELCEEVTCQQGKVLFWESEDAEKLYVLLAGEITIFIQLSSRPERVTMSVINEPGQIFGWSGLVAPFYYTASALCESDCRVLAVDGASLMQALEQDPEMGFVVIRRLSEVISKRMRHTRSALLKTM
jgi:CRP-like cAMP-binding protein